MVPRQGVGRLSRIYVPRKRTVWLAAFFLFCAGPLFHFKALALDDAETEGFPRYEAPAFNEIEAEGVKADSGPQAAESADAEDAKPQPEQQELKAADAEETRPHPEARAAETDDLQSVAPALVTRDMWNAEPALDGMWPHKPNGIVIHHTGVGRNLMSTLQQKMKGLQHFSQRMMHPGPMGRTIWLDAPYHFYIDAKGELAEGRDARFSSDSNTLYDTYGILQVVVEGNFQREMPDPRQIEALKKTLVWLSLKWNIHPDKIVWHRAKAATNCPGKFLLNQLPQMSVEIIEMREKAIAEICGKNPSPAFSSAYCGSSAEHAGLN